MRHRAAYYYRDADIAWFPTGASDDVVREHVTGGLHECDRTTRKLVAIVVRDASTRLPASLLDALPEPEWPPTTSFTGFPPLREDDDIVPVRAWPID